MAPNESKNIFITGGAGFLGSAFTERLLTIPNISQITIFDRNACKQEHTQAIENHSRASLITGDLKDLDALIKAMEGHDTVLHLASNADISRAATQPTIDFEEGTLLTQNTLEAARINGVERVLYASGSGVYGDRGTTELCEDDGPFLPISTYGASKLAGESLLSAYCNMFETTGIAFRFANIVGPGQTHGIALDFVEKLMSDPTQLEILGDGSQTKSYIHIDDVFDAVWLAHTSSTKKFDVFNVSTPDAISVNQIARIAIEEVLGKDAAVKLKYTGGDRGWKGDVPVVRLNSTKITSLGFAPNHTSEEAVRLAIMGILEKQKSVTSR